MYQNTYDNDTRIGTAIDRYQSMRRFVVSGNVENLRKCLASCPPSYVDIPDQRGNSCLHVAVDAQNLDCVMLLLSFKASVVKFGFEEDTPLHVASKRSGSQSEAIMQALLAADPTALKCCDLRCAKRTTHILDVYSQLHSKCLEADSAVAKASNIAMNEFISELRNKKKTGGVGPLFTPLHTAVKCSNTNAVRCLLEAGADIHARFIVFNKGKSNDESDGDCERLEDAADPNNLESISARMRNPHVLAINTITLAKEIFSKTGSLNSEEVLDILQEYIKKMQPITQNDETDVACVFGKRPSPEHSTVVSVSNETEWQSALEYSEVTAINPNKGAETYMDMLGHMWDDEDPLVRRQAEYEASIRLYPLPDGMQASL